MGEYVLLASPVNFLIFALYNCFQSTLKNRRDVKSQINASLRTLYQIKCIHTYYVVSLVISWSTLYETMSKVDVVVLIYDVVQPQSICHSFIINVVNFLYHVL